MRNKIPDILNTRNLNITDFHSLLVSNTATRVSYPTVHKLATEANIPSKMEVHTLAKVATALEVTLNDLVEIEIG